MVFEVVREEGNVRLEQDTVDRKQFRSTFFKRPRFGPNDAIENGGELKVRHPRIVAVGKDSFIALRKRGEGPLGRIHLIPQRFLDPGWADIPLRPVRNGRTTRSWNYGPVRARLGTDGKWTFRLTPAQQNTFRLIIRINPDTLGTPTLTIPREGGTAVAAQWPNGLVFHWRDMIADVDQVTVTAQDAVRIVTNSVVLDGTVGEVKVYDPTFSDDADWGSDVDDSGNKYVQDGADWAGKDTGDNIYRTANKFTISTLPTDHGVDQVDLEVSVTTVVAMGSDTNSIGPYNGDGQADPESDAGSTMYTRCDVSSDNYVSGTTTLRTTGIKTFTDLGAQANADVEAARDAGTIFSVAVKLDAETFNATDNYIQFEEFDETNPFSLTVTHSATSTTMIADAGSYAWTGQSADLNRDATDFIPGSVRY